MKNNCNTLSLAQHFGGTFSKKWGRTFLSLWVAGVLMGGGILACATLSPSPDSEKKDSAEPSAPSTAVQANSLNEIPNLSEPFGPPTPQPEETVAYGPEPIQLRPITLVLGPGLARGFAHAGILQELHAAKIPIGAIVATEMGALLGILYGLNETIHAFEWKIQKIKENLFLKKKSFFHPLFKGPGDGKELDTLLKQLLGEKNIEESKIPLYIFLQDFNSRELRLMTKGSAAGIARASASLPHLIKPVHWNEKYWAPTFSERPFPVFEAKKIASGPVVAVDLFGDKIQNANSPQEQKLIPLIEASIQNGSAEIQNADIILRPNLNQIGYLDFQKKTECIFRGKLAVQAEMHSLRQWVGLPIESQETSP